jgi:hypothetical protein
MRLAREFAPQAGRRLGSGEDHSARIGPVPMAQIPVSVASSFPL